MKLKEYILKDPQDDHRFIPQEAEAAAEYIGLDSKTTLRLRLLSEELICMLPQLLSYGAGKFWIEVGENRAELHLSVSVDNSRYYDVNKILSVSTSGKNAAAKGILGKIAVAVEDDLLDASLESLFSHQLTHFCSLLFLRHGFHTQRRSGGECVAGQIVNNLNVNLLV